MNARGSTIKSSREIDAIFRGGKRTANSSLIVLTRSTPTGRDPRGRVAFVAGKKLGSAVTRNRSKRILREAVNRARGPWPGVDVVLIARARTRLLSAPEVDRELAALLDRAGVPR